jgi:hypothetical protein
MSETVTLLRARIGGESGAVKAFKGRAAWALDRLVSAGQSGCTPIDQPAPRWSPYIFLLRRDGVDVETIHENHGGAYAGHHARYLLRTSVEIIERQEAA